MNCSFDFVDLFAGLGGFHLAASKLGGRCVFASEIVPELRDLYRRNFDFNPAGDINGCKPISVAPHDALFAGFPCQPFSKAGAQLGWKDLVRGTLFFKIVEILEIHHPRFVILENVANFARHDGGNTFDLVNASLEALGYDVDFRHFSPHQFGIPQLRERIYIVARCKKIGGLADFKWPNEIHGPLDLSTVLDPSDEGKGVSPLVARALELWQEFLDKFPGNEELPSFPIWAQEFGADYPTNVNSLYKVPVATLLGSRGSFGAPLVGRTKASILEGVPSHARYLIDTFPVWKQTFIRQNRALYAANQAWLDKWIPKLQGLPPSLTKLEWNCKGSRRDIYDHILQFRASGIRVKRRSYSPALVAMTTTQVPYIGWKKRFMSAPECARLQSMRELKEIPVTASLAYKSLGNAVNVTVVGAIMESILRLPVSPIVKNLPRAQRTLSGETSVELA